MKKLKLNLLLIMALLPMLSIAQQRGEEWASKPPEERANAITEWMKREIPLTDEAQIQEVYTINLKYAEKSGEMQTGSKMDRFRKFKEYSSMKDEELKNVFTEEQYKSYESKKKKMRDELQSK